MEDKADKIEFKKFDFGGAEMNHILKTNNLYKEYGIKGFKTQVLNNISLTVEEGEFIAIMGPSGAGKTTLLNLLSTIDKPTKGEIILDGRDITKMKSKELSQLRKDSIGFIFQDYSLLDNMNLMDNIAFGTFLFLVFVLAEASIIYTKIYSDAMEDKEKYKILSRIGATKKDLERAIQKEIALFYTLPLAIGLIDSFFAIQALGDFLSENLLGTFAISAMVCIGIFAVSYMVSVASFKKIVKVIY